MYKSGDVGGAGRRLGGIRLGAPGTGDLFVATVHRLVQGISWLWLGGFGRARGMPAQGGGGGRGGRHPPPPLPPPGWRGPGRGGARGALARGATLVPAGEWVMGRPRSALHFAAMFPRGAAARLAARRGEWGKAERVAASAVGLGRRGAGRVELAAAL